MMRNGMFGGLLATSMMVAMAANKGDGGGGAPAPEPEAVREPVTARGAELIELIAATGDDGLRLTQDEGMDLVNAGFAVAVQDDQSAEDGTAVVRLTEAGEQQRTSEDVVEVDGVIQAANSGGFAIETDVPMPGSRRRKTGAPVYPLDTMPVNSSFHVPKTKENPDPANRVASSVAAARVKYSEEIPGKTETVTVKTYKKNPDGKGFAKDAEGKRILETSKDEVRPKMRQTREYQVFTVGSDDPKGEGARVYRTK